MGATTSNDEPEVATRQPLERRGLLDRLAASDAEVVVVHGPTGTGKSELLRQWHNAETRSAWIELGPDQRDREQLRSVLADAIGAAFASADILIEVNQPSGAIVVDELERALEATSRLGAGSEILLFIDGVERLGGSAAELELGRLVDSRPAGLRLGLSARSLQSVSLARVRLDGQLLEVGPGELAFTAHEIGELFDRQKQPLSPEQIQVVQHHTEGWAAAVRLVAMQLAHIRSSDQGTIDAGLESLGEALPLFIDYLDTEVLSALDEDDLDMLSDVAVLDALTGALCVAVTGQPDAGDRLWRLEQLGVWLVPMEDRIGWYRLHPMLAARLRAKAPLVAEPPKQRLQRAARWSLTAGSVEDALDLAFAAGDLRLAADIVCEKWYPRLQRTGGVAETISDLKRFRDQDILDYQPLAIVAAVVFGFTNDRERFERYEAAALTGTFSGRPPDGAASIMTSLALMRASMGRGEDNLAGGDIALELEPPDSPWRTMALMVRGIGLVDLGRHTEAEPVLREAADAGQDHRVMSGRANLELAQIALQLGDVQTARERSRLSIALHSLPGTIANVDSLIDVTAALVAAAENDLVAAQRMYQAAIRGHPANPTASELVLVHSEAKLQMLLAQAAIEIEQPAAAQAHVDIARSLVAAEDPSFVEYARIAHVEEQLRRALR